VEYIILQCDAMVTACRFLNNDGYDMMKDDDDGKFHINRR